MDEWEKTLLPEKENGKKLYYLKKKMGKKLYYPKTKTFSLT